MTCHIDEQELARYKNVCVSIIKTSVNTISKILVSDNNRNETLK